MSISRSLTKWQSQTLWFRCLSAGALLTLFILMLTLPTRDHDAAKYATRPHSQSAAAGSADGSGEGWEFVVERDGDNHGLSGEQCRAAFPKLFVEIEKSVKARGEKKINFKELDSRPVEDGMVRGVIHHGEVFLFFPSFFLAPVRVLLSWCWADLDCLVVYYRVRKSYGYVYSRQSDASLAASCAGGVSGSAESPRYRIYIYDGGHEPRRVADLDILEAR